MQSAFVSGALSLQGYFLYSHALRSPARRYAPAPRWTFIRLLAGPWARLKSRSCSGHAPGPHRDPPGGEPLPRGNTHRCPFIRTSRAVIQRFDQVLSLATVAAAPILEHQARVACFNAVCNPSFAIEEAPFSRWAKIRSLGFPPSAPAQGEQGFVGRLAKRRGRWFCPPGLERWPSGRRRTPGKCVGGEPSRGFESLSLRQRLLLSLTH